MTIKITDNLLQPNKKGEDILVHDPDGLIYFGIVVEVDHDLGIVVKKNVEIQKVITEDIF